LQGTPALIGPTHIIESAYLPYNNNWLARQLIFKSIIDNSPKSVFHLGDLVGIGFLESEWGDIDKFVSQLVARKISFNPIPGNHEYLLFPNQGISLFKNKFPEADIHGYSKQFGNTAVVLFNSNFGELTEGEKQGELRWFIKTLRDYEADGLIDFIIVGCHHAPYTNSKIVSPSAYDTTMLKFLNAFNRTSKCRLFISGHAHAYEHFNVNNKDFLVIGGGGGPQHPLFSGKDLRFNDLVKMPTDRRMFHYITIKVYKNSLWIDLNMVSEDFKGIKTIPQFTLYHK
jgi:3',5'-cyclic AMP phosphodiesterase CpdA